MCPLSPPHSSIFYNFFLITSLSIIPDYYKVHKTSHILNFQNAMASSREKMQYYKVKANTNSIYDKLVTRYIEAKIKDQVVSLLNLALEMSCSHVNKDTSKSDYMSNFNSFLEIPIMEKYAEKSYFETLFEIIKKDEINVEFAREDFCDFLDKEMDVSDLLIDYWIMEKLKIQARYSSYLGENMLVNTFKRFKNLRSEMFFYFYTNKKDEELACEVYCFIRKVEDLVLEKAENFFQAGNLVTPEDHPLTIVGHFMESRVTSDKPNVFVVNSSTNKDSLVFQKPVRGLTMKEARVTQLLVEYIIYKKENIYKGGISGDVRGSNLNFTIISQNIKKENDSDLLVHTLRFERLLVQKNEEFISFEELLIRARNTITIIKEIFYYLENIKILKEQFFFTQNILDELFFYCTKEEKILKTHLLYLSLFPYSFPDTPEESTIANFYVEKGFIDFETALINFQKDFKKFPESIFLELCPDSYSTPSTVFPQNFSNIPIIQEPKINHITTSFSYNTEVEKKELSNINIKSKISKYLDSMNSVNLFDDFVLWESDQEHKKISDDFDNDEINEFVVGAKPKTSIVPERGSDYYKKGLEFDTYVLSNQRNEVPPELFHTYNDNSLFATISSEEDFGAQRLFLTVTLSVPKIYENGIGILRFFYNISSLYSLMNGNKESLMKSVRGNSVNDTAKDFKQKFWTSLGDYKKDVREYLAPVLNILRAESPSTFFFFLFQKYKYVSEHLKEAKGSNFNVASYIDPRIKKELGSVHIPTGVFLTRPKNDLQALRLYVTFLTQEKSIVENYLSEIYRLFCSVFEKFSSLNEKDFEKKYDLLANWGSVMLYSDKKVPTVLEEDLSKICARKDLIVSIVSLNRCFKQVKEIFNPLNENKATINWAITSGTFNSLRPYTNAPCEKRPQVAKSSNEKELEAFLDSFEYIMGLKKLTLTSPPNKTQRRKSFGANVKRRLKEGSSGNERDNASDKFNDEISRLSEYLIVWGTRGGFLVGAKLVTKNWVSLEKETPDQRTYETVFLALLLNTLHESKKELSVELMGQQGRVQRVDFDFSLQLLLFEDSYYISISLFSNNKAFKELNKMDIKKIWDAFGRTLLDEIGKTIIYCI